MDTDRLAVFRAVAREGGFSRAAQRLFRTQPAVSQSIRALEEELGQRLFDRRGRRTTLTQAGRILLGHADAAFASLECARNEMAELSTLSPDHPKCETRWPKWPSKGSGIRTLSSLAD